MKTLQNDFTTPEQSKRLLELGLPADSANMRYREECVRAQLLLYDSLALIHNLRH